MSNRSCRNSLRWLYLLTFIFLVGFGVLAYLLLTGYELTRQLDRRWDVYVTRPGASTRSPIPTAAETAMFMPTVAAEVELTTRSVDGMVMVYIPPGDFLMGALPGPSVMSYERPQHVVYLDGYWIDRTEVTNAMFQKFLKETAYAFDGVTSGSASAHPDF